MAKVNWGITKWNISLHNSKSVPHKYLIVFPPFFFHLLQHSGPTRFEVCGREQTRPRPEYEAHLQLCNARRSHLLHWHSQEG